MGHRILNMGAVATSLDQLRQRLEQSSVPSIFPDAPEFKKLAQSYNRVFSYEPAAICLPENDDDVVNAIKSARDLALKIQPKGGGHSYAAYSSGGQDGSLIIYSKHHIFPATDPRLSCFEMFLNRTL